MPYKVRRFACSGCGIPVVKRAREADPQYCVTCGINRAVESARQLHAHHGPFYDSWVRGYLAAAHRILASTGPVEWPSAN